MSSLGDLPIDCIAAIIGRTTPLDACRLASVSQAFSAAASSELVWQGLLPSDVRGECCDYRDGWKSWKELLQALAEGIFVSGGRQKYLLLRRTGGVCRILSVAGMGVTWGQDARFWRWEDSRSSCFGKVAHLLAVCRLEVFGKWKCSLTPGKYSATWRLKVANPQFGQILYLAWKKPLLFRLKITHGKVLEKELDLMKQVPVTGFEQWFEFEVGQIVVEGERLIAQPLELEFCIREVDCSYWKGGLYLDCLTLRPTEEEKN
ncbi:hypothetical protein SELMODRAFT_271662 [Selaginella moellendorffii]|uniref:F-box domain-containing protein n=1 Tax=Selaginella moellendorffii TaxID=88036 RepID=D8SK93_SELML|nr:F-box protein PP2-A15 [Selaginella moellendorffii]XP_002989080.1 F-box protein PP2-A15 [Selaginella moellendorffii]EFJ09874.1 hypothetical protein SELMODRAFT_184275 [Selaginella moellendorffii]EFJ15188.1 hypothetical protein SELMODRAFT_271662 [Selaginella moellendorffii]|eukprot:XP_002983692.1 F-box protein PP2-A15 [Selaginella moellendorffii]